MGKMSNGARNLLLAVLAMLVFAQAGPVAAQAVDPGATARHVSGCATMSLNSSANTIAFTMPAPTYPPIRAAGPSAETTELTAVPATMPPPSTPSIMRPRSRFTMKFGRVRRGTFHTVLSASWVTWVAPSPDHSARTTPTARASPLPPIDFGSIPRGNRSASVCEMSARSSGFPSRTKPRIVNATSSNGNIEKNP